MPLSTFLNGRAPTRLRGLLWLALSETADVLSATSTSDSGGGVSQVWGTTGAGVPCRVDPLGGMGGVLLAGRIDERSTHLVTVPTGSTVGDNDRVVIHGRGTFEVTATHEQTAEFSASFEVIQVV